MKLFVRKLFASIGHLMLHNTLVVNPLVQERIFKQILQGRRVIARGRHKSRTFFRRFVELRSRSPRFFLHRVFEILTREHFVVVRVLLVQKLILTERQLQVRVEILDNNAVEHGIGIVLEHV